MQETLFERFLRESFTKVDEFQGKEMTALEVMETFFPHKTAMLVNRYQPRKNKKNAIILVGPSCCGKTTYARKFVQKWPSFKLISMDECAIDDMIEMSEEERILLMFGINGASIDDVGNRRFGRMLEEGHKNIIVDGCWLNVNSRGALLRTLSELNYHTCLFLCNPKKTSHDAKIRKRVCEGIAARRMNIREAEKLRKVECLKQYAKKMHVSEAYAMEMIESSNEFKNSYRRECEMLIAELQDANYFAQLESYVIFIGADELFEVQVL